MPGLIRPPLLASNSINRLLTPPAGAVLYLPGVGDPQSATIRDRSGNNNHGTLYGPTWERLSSGLPILNFDGSDDYIDCGSDASLAGVVSFETWVYRTNNATVDYICDFRNAGGGAGYILMGIAGNIVTVSAGTVYVDGAATTTLGIAAWHHVVVAGITFTAGGPLILGRRYNAQDCWVGKQILWCVHPTTLSAGDVVNRWRQTRHLFGV